jgi:hypothetical protein
VITTARDRLVRVLVSVARVAALNVEPLVSWTPESVEAQARACCRGARRCQCRYRCRCRAGTRDQAARGSGCSPSSNGAARSPKWDGGWSVSARDRGTRSPHRSSPSRGSCRAGPRRRRGRRAARRHRRIRWAGAALVAGRLDMSTLTSGTRSRCGVRYRSEAPGVAALRVGVDRVRVSIRPRTLGPESACSSIALDARLEDADADPASRRHERHAQVVARPVSVPTFTPIHSCSSAALVDRHPEGRLANGTGCSTDPPATSR